MDLHAKLSLVIVFCLFGHIQNGVAFHVHENEYDSIGIHYLNQSFLSEKKGNAKCNLLAGTWVRDESYPLYSATQCPYIDGKSTCRSNGRSDSDYEKWRWQPYGCNMPRFNAVNMLERLRGKRLMFVGDSTNRDQWESMVCLLSTVIPNSRRSVVYGIPLTIFRALDYRTSVEFFWAPFLVEFNKNRRGKKILHVDAIDKYGAFWKGVDILVFETSHWWTHSGSDKAWDRVKIGHHSYADMDPMVAYRKALVTWAKWVSANINPTRSVVYFRTMSPKHDTVGGNGQNCYKATEPLPARRGYLPPVPPQVPILEYILKKTGFPVHLLDITRLSSYRVDGHPSVYSKRLTGYQKSRPQLYADCSHWCLPGVPDTWNELLYASLVWHYS